MKRFALFLLPTILLCPHLWATTHVATSCSSTDFATALASAADGDTVQGPVGGGTATWSGTVTVNKGITFNGNGCSVTLPSGAGVLTINTDSTPFVMTGFTFSNCTGGSNPAVLVNMASAPPYNAAWRIYNNTFSGAGLCIETLGLGPGLFDHNTINVSGNAAETVHIQGGQPNCSSCWNEDVVPGGADMVFFENNEWTTTSTSIYYQAEEAFYGAVFVLRDNYINLGQGDIHAGGQYGPGGRWAEIYNNTFNDCCTSSQYYQFRGGSGVMFGNSITNPNASHAQTYTLGPDGGSNDAVGSYPQTYQFGTGISGTDYSPVYIGNWNGTITQGVYSQNVMVASGNAPVDAAHCSGLSGLPANTCNAINTGASLAGTTLLRCESAADITAGCPVSYTYTPYAYPHPMDNCSPSQYGSGATCGVQPGAPTGLSGSLQTQ